MTTTSDRPSPADLNDVVSLLLSASRALVAVSARSLTEVEDHLTLSEFRALVVLQSHGAASVGSLARRLGLGAEAGERVVSRLSDDGSLRREADDVLRLTSQGEELVTRVTEHRREALGEIATRMTQNERELLVEALITFARAAGEPIAVESPAPLDRTAR